MFLINYLLLKCTSMLVPEMHGGAPKSLPRQVKMESHHITFIVLVQHKTQPKKLLSEMVFRNGINK